MNSLNHGETSDIEDHVMGIDPQLLSEEDPQKIRNIIERRRGSSDAGMGELLPPPTSKIPDYVLARSVTVVQEPTSPVE